MFARTLLCSLALGSTALAQSPVVTTFTGSMNLDPGSVFYMDWEALRDLTVTGLDVHLENGTPGANLMIWTRSGSWLPDADESAAGWTLSSTGTIPAPNSAGTPSSVVLSSPIPLAAGTHGIMIQYLVAGQEFTDGLFPLGANVAGSNSDMIIYEGGAGNSPFNGLCCAPRIWNGRVYYDLGLFSYPEACNGDGGDQMGCSLCPCGNDAAPGTVGGCMNSAATSARLLASGIASVSAPDPSDLRFEMQGGVPSSFAVLTSGAAIAPANPANPCFGLDSGIQSNVLDGLRCAVQSTQRHGGRPVDAAGQVGIGNNGWGGASGPPSGLASQGGFTPGQTRHFQAFYRELPGVVCATEQNTTQAISVTFVL